MWAKCQRPILTGECTEVEKSIKARISSLLQLKMQPADQQPYYDLGHVRDAYSQARPKNHWIRIYMYQLPKWCTQYTCKKQDKFKKLCSDFPVPAQHQWRSCLSSLPLQYSWPWTALPFIHSPQTFAFFFHLYSIIM